MLYGLLLAKTLVGVFLLGILFEIDYRVGGVNTPTEHLARPLDTKGHKVNKVEEANHHIERVENDEGGVLHIEHNLQCRKVGGAARAFAHHSATNSCCLLAHTATESQEARKYGNGDCNDADDGNLQRGLHGELLEVTAVKHHWKCQRNGDGRDCILQLGVFGRNKIEVGNDDAEEIENQHRTDFAQHLPFVARPQHHRRREEIE